MKKMILAASLLSALGACSGAPSEVPDSTPYPSSYSVQSPHSPTYSTPNKSSAEAQAECEAYIVAAIKLTRQQPTMDYCTRAMTAAMQLCSDSKRAAADYNNAFAKHGYNREVTDWVAINQCHKWLPRLHAGSTSAPRNRIIPSTPAKPAEPLPAGGTGPIQEI